MARIAGKGRPAITAQMKLAALKPWACVTCAVCRLGNHIDDVQFDHALALINGGAHSVENLRPVCITCHRKKSAGEHKANSKAKRLSTARQIHEAAKRGEYIRPPSRLKGKGFEKGLRRKMDGSVERRG